MRFLPLLLANLRRKKIRTTLTIGSFAVALFLFGLLAAIHFGFRQGIDVAGADRLVVIGRTSLIQPLRLTYGDRIRRIPGVKHVAHSTWFGGVYQDPKNFFPQFAIVPEDWLTMYPEFVVDEDEWREFVADRQGVIAGRKLAARFGWKVGDRIPLRGTIFGGSWDFNLRGIYRGLRPQDDETQFWLRHDYLNEKGPQWWRGLVGWYVIRVARPDDPVVFQEPHEYMWVGGITFYARRPVLILKDPKFDGVAARRREPPDRFVDREGLLRLWTSGRRVVVVADGGGDLPAVLHQARPATVLGQSGGRVVLRPRAPDASEDAPAVRSDEPHRSRARQEIRPAEAKVLRKGQQQ